MRAAGVITVVLGLGVALGLVLTCPAGIFGGLYWFFVIAAAGACVGWLLAQLYSAPFSLVAAPVLVVFMIAVMLGVKVVRMPLAPLVGDGFEIGLAISAAAGALGALLGLAPWLRASTPAVAARIGLWPAAAAVAVSAAPYAFAAVSG